MTETPPPPEGEPTVLDIIETRSTPFVLVDDHLHIRREAENKPCPCCGQPVAGSKLPRYP